VKVCKRVTTVLAFFSTETSAGPVVPLDATLHQEMDFVSKN
jgi:hypothetical protein